MVAVGRRLHGTTMKWTSGARTGSDTCAQDVTPAKAKLPSGQESCAYAIPRDLPVDPSALKVAIFPAGSRVVADAVFFDATGHRLPESAFEQPIAEITLHQVVSADASVDLSSGLGHVPLSHPDAIASVSCIDASCEISGSDLVVRGERGSDEVLEARFQLRPHVTLRGATGGADTAAVVMLPLQRCPVSLASATVVASVEDERVVLRVDGSCARAGGDLAVTTAEGTGRIERTESVGNSSFIVVAIPRIESSTLVLTLRRHGTIIGTVRSPTHRFTWRAKLELAGHGAIDFIPTNRFARVLLPPPPAGAALTVRPVDGVYEVKRGRNDEIRGYDGTGGSAPLRLALIDTQLPAPLTGTVIAETNEPVDRALRRADVPVPLVARAREKNPFVEMLCGDGEGHAERIPIAATTSIAYRARDTCQLVFHRERLNAEDGAQSLRVSVTVTGSDGAVKSEAHVDERVVLRKSDHPFYMAIGGATDAFDRFLVRVGNSAEGVADEQTPEEPEHRAPQAQWSVVAGTSRARIYGTTAIPTGLFRLADTGHSGILTLSVGALLRLVALSRDGDAFPLGLEAGVMWLGIAGDSDPSVNSHGVVALVAGPGIAVPIANVSRASQTSINLHGWFEYEVSREVLGQQGQAFGFVFGPSISIGDVGANF